MAFILWGYICIREAEQGRMTQKFHSLEVMAFFPLSRAHSNVATTLIDLVELWVVWSQEDSHKEKVKIAFQEIKEPYYEVDRYIRALHWKTGEKFPYVGSV